MPDRPCAHCGKPILSKNIRAEYCSASCRVRACQKRKEDIGLNRTIAVAEYVTRWQTAEAEVQRLNSLLWSLAAEITVLREGRQRDPASAPVISEADRKAVVRALHPNSNPSKATLAKAYAAWQNIAE
ncbi:hypothetical protein ACEUZ9_001347 [Paracoccus litorisediminis]|uniref:hypothetical protein n=1 Tax=Paracoccus litorisediminis TaxID=2006130 RepID=UPI00372F1F09